MKREPGDTRIDELCLFVSVIAGLYVLMRFDNLFWAATAALLTFLALAGVYSAIALLLGWPTMRMRAVLESVIALFPLP